MSRDESVENLVRRWQSLRERGESITVEQLCADEPETAGAVEERIKAIASMAAFLDLDSGLDDCPRAATVSLPPRQPQGQDGAGNGAGGRPLLPASIDDLSDPSSAGGGFNVEETAAFPGQGLWHERYKLGAKLGEGGMGVVYRARDGRDGRNVALKRMKGTLSGTARRRFEREFRSLATLNHPHCLRVYDYGELDGGPFFTMELFAGAPITSLAGRSTTEVLGPLFQLSQALDYIHGHGVIHRDVKPSNVLVRTSARADGSTYLESRLMDFGLAKYYGVKSSLSAEAGFVGTVAYCAPEQLNLDELDHRADLFCLGLVGYELLAGRYPFAEARLAGMRPLMQALLNDKPRPLGEVNPEVPVPIAAALMKYLRKQPRRRPNSAALLRDAIAEYLGIVEPAAASIVSIARERVQLSVTGFVCRAAEQEAVAEQIARCLSLERQGGTAAVPSLIIVSGEPGIGKSSVVQEAERLARGHGCQVYEGRCFDGNLSPFQPFVEVLRQLVAELKLQERREGAAAAPIPADDLTGTLAGALPSNTLVKLLGIVGQYSGELLRIAPELRKYLAGEAFQHLDLASDADYLYRALAAFFLEVAALQPICLSFEDLQWADKSSLDLLKHLIASLAEARRKGGGGSGPPRMVILTSARSGYEHLEAFLAHPRDQRRLLELRLAPLSVAETRELIALRLNCAPEEVDAELVARIYSLCGGNPFFVAETVRDWYEKEAITRSESGWVLSTAVADASDLPETVRDVMRLRLQGLSQETQQVLAAAAVIGAVVDIDLLEEVLTDLSESDVLDAIDVLLPRRVFRETGNAGRVEFVHDLLREMTYANLSAARRRSLHRRVAELLEARRGAGQGVPAAVLAEHFRNSEDRAKAFLYTLEAAESAMNAYAFTNALAQLNEAIELCLPETGDATRHRLWQMRGDTFGALSRTAEAVEAYEQALKYAGDSFERAMAYQMIGEMIHHQGDAYGAIVPLDAALREIGFPRPRTAVGRIVDVLWTSFSFHFLTYFTKLGPLGDDRKRRIEIACLTYSRLYQILCIQNVFFYVHACYRFALLGLLSRDPELAFYSYAKFTVNMGMFSFEGISKHYIRRYEKAAALCKGDRVTALARGHLGCAYYFAGRLDEAEREFLAAKETLDKVGDWFGIFTHHTLRHIHGIRGETQAELAEASWEIATGTTRGDDETLAWGRYGRACALARSGAFAEAIELTTVAAESLVARRSTTTIGIAYCMVSFAKLQASDYAGAREAAKAARYYSVRAFCVYEYVGIGFPLLVESLLGPHWGDPDPAKRPGRAIARKAWLESIVARFVGWRFPNYRPHALRVSGRAAFALGHAKRAARYFERAAEGAEKLGARFDLARAWLDASRVVPDKAEDYRRRGQALLDELGAVVPEAERFAEA